MAVELVPEMAQNVFRPLMHRLENSRSEEDFLAGEIRELISGCGMGAAVLDQMLEIFHDILRRGVERRKLHFLNKEFLDLVELAAHQLYPKIRRLAAGDQIPHEERMSNLAKLDAYMQRAQVIHQELTSLQPLLDKPLPSIDSAKFKQSGAKNYQGYEDSMDLQTRLNSGGDI